MTVERPINLPERKAVKAALRSAGLSDRQTQALLKSGWGALVGESNAEASELQDQLDSLLRQLQPPA